MGTAFVPSETLRSTLVTKNVMINGRRTSVKLEPTELAALNAICARENLSIHEFCKRADNSPRRQEASRTGRIRMAILEYCMAQTPTLATAALASRAPIDGGGHRRG
jgi:predicted DNA-binding ribbon-helix-helix protein